MSKSNEEAPQVYYIPGNYEDSGGVLGGRLGTRNAVELCVICGPIAFLEFKLLHFSIQTNLIIAIVTLLPLAALCIFGIGGETLSQILFALIRYFRKRRLLHYDKFTPVEETTAAGAFSLDKFLDIASSSGVKAAVAKFQEDREGNTQADTQKKKKKAVKQKKKRTSGAAGGDGDQEIRDELRRQEREIKGQTKGWMDAAKQDKGHKAFNNPFRKPKR